jgi:hypothetical protein
VGQGDCCDTPGICGKPELVNPGAFEYLGNGVDDDCDAVTADYLPVPDCGPGALEVPTSGEDLLRSMDICQFTKETLPKAKQKWGVISSQLLFADGSPNPKIETTGNVQVGVLANYGLYVKPQKGSTMASLSCGTARDLGDAGYVHPQNGTVTGQLGSYNANTRVQVPAAYLKEHDGKVPSPGNCPICVPPTNPDGGAPPPNDCIAAFDSVNLKARIRVPTNAFSFSYKFKFYTAEYPEFICQKFNDFFVVLLDSSWVPNPKANPPELPLPADKNIAFDAQKNAVSVNNGFFEVCYPFKTGDCPGGTLDLEGTGMGGWGTNYKDGGGTEWLTNDAPVVPGETIELQFIIWDAGDHNVDSLVLLDKFRWNVTPSPVGVHK